MNTKRAKAYQSVRDYLKKNPSASIAKACDELGVKRYDYHNHKSYLATHKNKISKETAKKNIKVRIAPKMPKEIRGGFDTSVLKSVRAILSIPHLSDTDKVNLLNTCVIH